jgi:hypothetical protein
MPRGKPAGVRCVNLDSESHRCRIWGTDAYPDVCRRFDASPETCGTTRSEAITLLTGLEQGTSPAPE